MSHFVLLRDGTTAATEKYLANVPIAFVNTAGGVVKTTDYLVTAQGSSQLAVSAGRAYVPLTSPPMMYPTYLDTAVTNVQVSPNNSSPSHTRADAVVLYIDLSASVDSSASNVAKIVCVAGPVDGSNVIPTNAQILAAIGASNPYIILAQIGNVAGGYLANGFTTINSSQITDLRTFASFNTGVAVPVQTYEEFTDQSSTPATPASGFTRFYTKAGTMFALTPGSTPVQVTNNSVVPLGNSGNSVTVDWSQGTTQTLTLAPVSGSNVAITMTNPISGVKLTLKFLQDATGSRTTSYTTSGSTLKWPNSTAPVLSTGIGKEDLIGFVYIGTTYYGFSSLTY